MKILQYAMSTANNNKKSMCHDLINSMVCQACQLDLDSKAKQLDFEKQQAELHSIELEIAIFEQKDKWS